MVKFFIVRLEVYPFDIAVSIGQTDEELKESYSKYEVKWSKRMKLGRSRGIFLIGKDNTSLIRIRQAIDSPVWYGVLQHEIFHAVTFILDRTGMKFELLKSDEAYAYLTGYITEKVYEALFTKVDTEDNA